MSKLVVQKVTEAGIFICKKLTFAWFSWIFLTVKGKKKVKLLQSTPLGRIRGVEV